MDTRNVAILLLLSVFLLKVNITMSVIWSRIRCSTDPDPNMEDGTTADIGRFPWLGVVQHSFCFEHIRCPSSGSYAARSRNTCIHDVHVDVGIVGLVGAILTIYIAQEQIENLVLRPVNVPYMGGKNQFAITAGVLIHPAYAIAPAEDISRINQEQITNNTEFILWRSATVKYALPVTDYVLHPEFDEQGTYATIALLELHTSGETGVGENSAPVLPVCLPISGAGSFTDLFAVKMTDENKELQKEVYKVSYVENKKCDDFYYMHKLTFKKMTPAFPICAKTERDMEPCVWDGGVALITRQSWGFWKILGFSVRGPGCGAPARFLNMNDYLPWINDMLTQLPVERIADVHRLGVRRLSPIEIVLYSADKLIPKEQGVCERKVRGNVLYKDSFEVVMNKNFATGFFYVVVSQIAQFKCAIVNLENISARTNAAVWLEHYCHREITGLAHGQKKPRDYRKQDCFLYFKSAAFVHFQFYFSFKVLVEVTLFGTEEIPRKIPFPFKRDETTDDWFPTNTLFNYGSFSPRALWYWYL